MKRDDIPDMFNWRFNFDVPFLHCISDLDLLRPYSGHLGAGFERGRHGFWESFLL